ILLTFFPHPRLIINPDDDNLRLINDIEEKTHRLALSGIDHLIITPFTRDFSNQTAEEYISNVLVGRLGTKQIVIGYDHHFGKDRQGSIKDLKEHAEIYDYTGEQITERENEHVGVSTSTIRESLTKGDLQPGNL